MQIASYVPLNLSDVLLKIFHSFLMNVSQILSKWMLIFLNGHNWSPPFFKSPHADLWEWWHQIATVWQHTRHTYLRTDFVCDNDDDWSDLRMYSGSCSLESTCSIYSSWPDHWATKISWPGWHWAWGPFIKDVIISIVFWRLPFLFY